MKWLIQITAIAAVYFLAAVLGVKLAAVASGNISPVWPATGIAIAVVYLGGYRMAPGVWFKNVRRDAGVPRLLHLFDSTMTYLVVLELESHPNPRQSGFLYNSLGQRRRG